MTGERTVDPHVYESENCIYCHANYLDQGIYGLTDCVPHDPAWYSTDPDNPRPEGYVDWSAVNPIYNDDWSHG